MKFRLLAGMLLSLLLPTLAFSIELPSSWATLVMENSRLANPGERVVRFSAAFLGTPYVANTLGGGPSLPEQLVARLDAVDCFTLLDYVEALRRSHAPEEFSRRLTEVRYQGGRIAWENRRHFFTDWAAAPGEGIMDVTSLVGGDRTQRVEKTLNFHADGTPYLPGVAARGRVVLYLPTEAVDADRLARLHPGDYLGIYTGEPGLDVSHVGIAVPDGQRWLFRHASSQRGKLKVVDDDLSAYLADRPGLVILRPQPLSPP